MFDISKYDCIGFDLDNTLLEYNVPNLSQLIYDSMASFLISQKGYAAKHLIKPFLSGQSFLQKGLAIDFQRGNLVKLGIEGLILRACHGTAILTSQEICDIYGNSGVWDLAYNYCKDPFQAWNGPLSQNIRCALDNFDLPTLLIYVRAVDTLDENNNNNVDYRKIWSDILDGLNYNYDRNCFQNGSGDFFPSVQANPDKYILKCPDATVRWLRQLKSDGKLVYLITGSACDYASFTASTAIGPSWRDLFDFIVFYARKPAFFSTERTYYALENSEETSPCKLNINTTAASQGNWKELQSILNEKAGRKSLRTIYIGDNMLQDVLAPVQFGCCETLAVCCDYTDTDSSVWGSYFHDSDGRSTYWSSILENTASHFVPNLSSLVHSVNANDGH